MTTSLLDFRAVPNGVLVDAEGIIRYAKYGGFRVENPDDVAAVERFLAGEDPGESPSHAGPYELTDAERDLVQTKLRLGHALNELGRKDEAIDVWTEALHRDPENLVIRKQIWSEKYPERFHPTIDWDWQKVQLQKEREAEIASGVCGPDGCPVPWQ